MSQDLCVVTCYYNPEGYRTKLHNYLVFEAALRASGLTLVTVECSMGQTDFELPDRAELVRVCARDVMWQKERLLNVAIDNVPRRFTKIAWLDCDLLFTNNNWAEDSSRMLERYPVVQPFDTVVRLPRGAVEDTGGGERWLGFAAAYAKQPHALLTGDFLGHGHTGFAWAARRDILAAHGLYDGCVAGSGDHMMAHAFAGDWHGRCIRRIFGDNTAHWRHFAAWSAAIYGNVRAAVSFVPGTLLHLWHGETQDRRYVHRNRDLAGFGFDPATDVVIGSEGCWEWSSDKPRLHQWAANYFGLRKEDGNPVGEEETFGRRYDSRRG
jgi:hypothetical protein